MSQLFASDGQSVEASASASVLPMNIQDLFPLGLIGLITVCQGTLKSLLQHHSSKISILWHSASFMVHFHIHTWRLEKPYLSLYRPLLAKWCLCSLVYCLGISWASLAAQTVKNLFAMQDTWVWSLGRKDPLEKEMATHSSILAWRIPWTEEPGVLHSMGSQSHTERQALSLLGISCCGCCCSVTKSYMTLCDLMNCSMPGFSVHHCLPEFPQT